MTAQDHIKANTAKLTPKEISDTDKMIAQISAEPTFKDSQQAFREAIAQGRLTDHQPDSRYAGNYMYMGTWDGKDAFKHTDTRQYLS